VYQRIAAIAADPVKQAVRLIKCRATWLGCEIQRER
jgi:hypothetical protein